MNFARLNEALRSLEVRCNRTLWPWPTPRDSVRAWGAEDLVTRLSRSRPGFLVAVTTYRRPRELASLLESLAVELHGAPAEPFLLVLNDAADALVDDASTRALVRERFGERAAWVDAPRRFGKFGFWRTHQTIYAAALASRAEFLLSLQDDVELAPDFMARLLRTWEATGRRDPRRRALYLFSSDDDEPHGRWLRFVREDAPDAAARRTDWLDLQGYLIDAEGLALLRHRLVPIPARCWRKDPTLSSGVARQLTLRLSRRAPIYQCYPPLVAHGSCPSLMNPEARARRPLDNRSFFA